ncbi:unnamed protein product [Zymoseptoria tritici ST99CH_3D7]|uniref:Uncharacterized protein n=1 Tax=Zymoseptoria tritici (strain ST99CH_3D7) TaxID=1276538 RepID=A0A1X7SAF6_ZYMT9|nr:unnamed protein product [Zymoseptoria tritici ST99CH_3D7]
MCVANIARLVLGRSCAEIAKAVAFLTNFLPLLPLCSTFFLHLRHTAPTDRPTNCSTTGSAQPATIEYTYFYKQHWQLECNTDFSL